VSHPKSSQTTDDEGRAHLGAMGYDFGMPGNDAYWKTVTVHADGYVPVSRERPWGPDGVVRFRLVERGLRVAGRVVDDVGRGLGGIPLELRAPGVPAIPLTTDEYGAFATTEAPPTAATLQVSGHAFFSDPESLTRPREGLEIVAWPVCVVRGRLRVEEGVTLPEDLVIRAEGHRGAAYVHGSQFTIWCRPGPVVLTIAGRVVATLEIAAGETVDDVTIELGSWIEGPDGS
jgi:hypothetical protein